jgi:DNA-directed RNA polymerase specialized sigma24 family protein
MEDPPKLPLHGDEAQLFDEFDAALRRRVQREVNTSHANIEDACAFAWLQFLRHQPDRDRAWRAWLVQVARREAYRLSRVEAREPIPPGFARRGRCARQLRGRTGRLSPGRGGS